MNIAPYVRFDEMRTAIFGTDERPKFIMLFSSWMLTGKTKIIYER